MTIAAELNSQKSFSLHFISSKTRYDLSEALSPLAMKESRGNVESMKMRPRREAEMVFTFQWSAFKKNSDFLSDLTSKKYRAQAVYQNEIHRAFELAVEVLNAIQVASSMLVDQVGQPRADPEFWRKLERDIWDTSSPDKPDELSRKILQAIDIVEKAVQPTLEKSLVGS
jgi:hypothetical protein